MAYFSRLTDIVTCNLSQLLAEAEQPEVAIREIIREMEEGVVGAKRAVAAATGNAERLEREVVDHKRQVAFWVERAKEHLKDSLESEARQSLLRRNEVNDLIHALADQHRSAVSTVEHLEKTQRALEARLAEALRKRCELFREHAAEIASSTAHLAVPEAVNCRLDEELAALKRELGTV